ncbi:MAG TPA: Mov34/MPN/PAD-1 family protein [Gemmataceae bacterium]|nr:Mov34/MPN/PAD-1 family protein [Gemmataceae bacterium]
MWRALLSAAGRWLNEFGRSLPRRRGTPAPASRGSYSASHYQPLRRVILTDGVGRTLFEEYAAHRGSERGEEETGWVILGLREAAQAVALATLPAGAGRNAGLAHVRFNASGQAIGSRIVRQLDKRLTILGVVHTHPGSLRHPSDADLQGDRGWVGQLRGQEGVFGIGTADGRDEGQALLARQPKPHVQSLGKLCLCWYALRQGDTAYRPLPVELTLGPDLARPLHSIWPTLEAHADRLDRLARQQANVSFDVTNGQAKPALAVSIPLAEPGDAIRVLLEGEEVRYYLMRGGEVLAAHPGEDRVDLGVYLLLAELATRY